jgi:hypothetical protein
MDVGRGHAPPLLVLIDESEHLDVLGRSGADVVQQRAPADHPDLQVGDVLLDHRGRCDHVVGTLVVDLAPAPHQGGPLLLRDVHRVVPPDPRALADWIPAMFQRWQADPPAPIDHGGAHSWDDVADDVMTAMLRAANLPQSLRHPSGALLYGVPDVA